MSRFPAQNTPQFGDDDDQPNRQARTDALVALNRARTPQNAIDQRRQPRKSIAEINAMDMDELRDRLAHSHDDGRTATEKVLDIIDLPRNTIANIAAGEPTAGGVAGLIAGPAAVGAGIGAFGGPPGALIGGAVGAGVGAVGGLVGLAGRALGSEEFRGKVAEEAEGAGTGAFGQKRIHTSDALRAMGVKNRLASGIAGFVGDVAFDPLTYAGPAGWGTKMAAGEAGKTLLLRGGQARSLKRAIADTAAGKALRPTDAPWGEYIARKAARDGVPLNDASALSAAVYGNAKTGLGGAVNRAFSVVGGEKERVGAGLVDDFYAPVVDDVAAAARNAVGQSLKGTGKALKIGLSADDIGSEVLHVPFTDMTVQVPAMSGAAKNARRAMVLSKLRDLGAGEDAIKELNALPTYSAMQAVNDADAEIRSLTDEARDARELYGDAADDVYKAEYDRILGEAKAALNQAKQAALLPTQVTSPQTLLARADALRSARLAYENAETQANSLRIARSLNLDTTSPEHAIQTIGEELWTKLQTNPDELDATADLLKMRMEAAAAHSQSIGDSMLNSLNSSDRQIVDWGKSLLGIDDDGVAMSVFGRAGKALKEWGVKRDFETLNNLDRFWRRTFGARGGTTAHDAQRALALAHDAQMRSTEATDGLYRQVKQAMAAAGLDGKDKNLTNEVMRYIYLRQHELIDPEGTIFHQWRFDPSGPKHAADGTLTNPSGLLNSIKTLRDNGVLRNPTARAALDDAAKQLNELYGQMGKAEIDDNLLRDGVFEGYIPLVRSQETADAIRGNRQAFPRGGPTTGGKDPFQIARTTWQTRFQDPETGKWHRFFDFDRESVGGLSDEAVKAAYPAQPNLVASMIEARDAIKRFDELGPEFAKQFPSRPTDPVELNEIAQTGRFDKLTGGNGSVTDFFSTNAAAVLDHRLASHQRAVAKRVLLNTITKNAVYIDPDRVTAIAQSPSRTVKLPSGLTVTIDTTAKSRIGNMQAAFEVNGERFRQIDDAVWRGMAGQLMDLRQQDARGMFVHERLADRIEDVSKMFDPKTINSLLGGLDRMTSLWKMLTLFHPSWPAFNIVGNSSLALSGGAKIEHMASPRRWRDAMTILRSFTNPELLNDIVIEAGGQRYTGQQFRNMLTEQRIVKNNLSLELAGQHLRKVPGMAAATDRTFRKYLGPWFRANQNADDTIRTLAFWSHLDQGNNVAGAAQKTLDSMFDFTDFTDVERETFRRLIPFYSWMRSNLGYQMNMLLERPQYAALAPKLKRAIEDSIAGESAVPEELRPNWMRDGLATQIGEDKDNRFALMFGNGVLPQTDVYNALLPLAGAEGAMKFVHYLTSSLNPILSTPLQLGSGTEFFSGRSIGAGPEYDIQPGEFLADQLRPVAEAGPGGRLGKAFDRSTTEGLARLAIGGRVQAFDEERLTSSKEREFRDMETGMRTKIRRAEREGRDSTPARAELMDLYRRMQRLGFDTPAWAEKQLEAIGAE